MKTKVKRVIDILKKEGFEATLNDYTIEFNRTEISNREIVENNNQIAWFEKCEVGPELRIKIYENDEKLVDWEPISDHIDWGCDVAYLQWVSDCLIFIYKEKHMAYIVKFDNQNISHVPMLGEALCIHENIVYFEQYSKAGEQKIDRITLPDLEILEPLSMEQFEETGLKIENIHYTFNQDT